MTEAQFARAVSASVMDRRPPVHPPVAAHVTRIQTLKCRLFPWVHAGRSMVFADEEMTAQPTPEHSGHVRAQGQTP
ncbi:MAG: hypothetical protein ABF636_13620 [Acetobacter sp.]